MNSKMTSARIQTQQQLGDWGITQVGDIAALTGDLVEQFCLSCQFDDFNPTFADVAFRGNAVDMYEILSAAYAADGRPLDPGTQPGNAVAITANDYDRVEEKVTSIYAQLSWKGDFAGRPAAVSRRSALGNHQGELVRECRRYRLTSSGTATTTSAAWSVRTSSGITSKGQYTNFLPSVDFRIEPMDNVVARVSLSKTLARPITAICSPRFRPTLRTVRRSSAASRPAAGGDPDLKPLVSGNLDISLEWYYAPSSYVSAGFFAKSVKNFVGQGTFDEQLFGLRDPSSGTAGSRSGTGGLAAQRVSAFRSATSACSPMRPC